MYLISVPFIAARIGRRSRRSAGFALVVTLSLLVLLTLLAVGLLTLSAVSLRAGSASEHRRQAQANARLALMLAIGELQKHAGPDRRVTADAAILDSTGGSGDPVGVAEAHWTGVWRATRGDGSSWYEYDSTAGGTQDQRWSTGWSAKGQALAWLVSGNERNGATYQPTAGSGTDSIKLVSALSAGGQQSGRVTAPRMALAAPDGHRGGYAWWVGDGGIRANVATPDRFANEEPGSGNATGWHRVMMAQDCEYPGEPLGEKLRALLVDRKSLELAGVRDPAAGFHDFTTGSAGVLTNTLEGGLKRDLTVFLESGGVIPAMTAGNRTLPGLRDSDNLVGPANVADAAARGISFARFRQRLVSPKFGLIRDWAASLRHDPGPWRRAARLTALRLGWHHAAPRPMPGVLAARRAALSEQRALPQRPVGRPGAGREPLLLSGSIQPRPRLPQTCAAHRGRPGPLADCRQASH